MNTLNNETRALLAKFFGYYTIIEEDGTVYVCPELKRYTTSLSPNQVCAKISYDPQNNASQLFDILDHFAYLAIEHASSDTWVIDYRVDLLDEKVTTVVGCTRTETILLCAVTEARE